MSRVLKQLTLKTRYALPEKNLPCEGFGTETNFWFSTHQISKPLARRLRIKQ